MNNQSHIKEILIDIYNMENGNVTHSDLIIQAENYNEEFDYNLSHSTLEAIVNEIIPNNPHNLEHYEHQALLYAEEYGIVEYEVSSNIMTYTESFPSEGKFLHTVNLDTLKETVEQIAKPSDDHYYL